MQMAASRVEVKKTKAKASVDLRLEVVRLQWACKSVHSALEALFREKTMANDDTQTILNERVVESAEMASDEYTDVLQEKEAVIGAMKTAKEEGKKELEKFAKKFLALQTLADEEAAKQFLSQCKDAAQDFRNCQMKNVQLAPKTAMGILKQHDRLFEKMQKAKDGKKRSIAEAVGGADSRHPHTPNPAFGMTTSACGTLYLQAIRLACTCRQSGCRFFCEWESFV